MSRLNRTQFRRCFEEAISPTDDLVVVYSGIWTFGHQFSVPIRDVPRMLIESMLEAVGSSRTLVLPSYTYAYAGERKYSPATSVPETGALPQAMWRAFSCTRTVSALNSFVAIGPQAHSLGEIRGQTLWGEDSLKGYFQRAHARMVTLGIPWKDSLGFLHRIEEAALVPYRYFKTFHGQWVEGDSSHPWAETMYVRSMDVMPVFVWSRVDELLRARSRIQEVNGPVFIESADAAEIVAAGLEIVNEDPYALLANPDVVRDWVINCKELEVDALRTAEPKALEWADRKAEEVT